MEYHFAILIIWRSLVQAQAGPRREKERESDFFDRSDSLLVSAGYRCPMQLTVPRLVTMAVRMAMMVWMMNFHVSFFIVVCVC